MTAAARTTERESVTFEQYMKEFRTQPPSHQPSYILDGVEVIPPTPGPIHQRIVDKLGVFLNAFEEGSAFRVFLSPLDVIIRKTPLRTRQPDILVLSDACCEAAGGLDMKSPITLAPDLVIEVLSPGEMRQSLDDKIADFQAIGVRECWIVFSRTETVEVLSLTKTTVTTVALYDQREAVQSVIFPGVRVAVAPIFT